MVRNHQQPSSFADGQQAKRGLEWLEMAKNSREQSLRTAKIVQVAVLPQGIWLTAVNRGLGEVFDVGGRAECIVGGRNHGQSSKKDLKWALMEKITA